MVASILHLISSSGFLGAENVVVELARESRAVGYKVTVGVFENQRNPHLEIARMTEASGIKVQVFPCRGRFDLKTISRIRTFMMSEQTNLLHSHGYKSNFYALGASRGKIPWVVTNHNWMRTTLNLELYAYLDGFLIRRANHVVAVSDAVAKEVLSRGISEENVSIINNGIDIERFSKRRSNGVLKQSFGFDEKTEIVGTVGRLAPEKGHLYLLRAARAILVAFPEARFLIVGDGPERGKLEEEAINLRIADKVVFAGNRADIPDLLSILTLFVLPSLNEGLPMALLEAMATRLPVIATRVGAVPKVVVDNENGLIVEPGNSEVLSLAVSNLLAQPEKAVDYGTQGYEKVKMEFSAKTMAANYFGIYKKVLTPFEKN